MGVNKKKFKKKKKQVELKGGYYHIWEIKANTQGAVLRMNTNFFEGTPLSLCVYVSTCVCMCVLQHFITVCTGEGWESGECKNPGKITSEDSETTPTTFYTKILISFSC